MGAINLPVPAWEINPQRTAEGEVMICGGEPYGLIAVVTTAEDAATIVQCVAERPALIAERDGLRRRVEDLEEALTASGATKAAYIGEFSFPIEDRDEDGEECTRKITVPWTTIKEVMSAIWVRADVTGAARFPIPRKPEDDR